MCTNTSTFARNSTFCQQLIQANNKVYKEPLWCILPVFSGFFGWRPVVGKCWMKCRYENCENMKVHLFYLELETKVGFLSNYLSERTRGRPWGRLRVRFRSIETKNSRTACCFVTRTFFKQYNCYENAAIWYTDHQYLAQYSEIINNLQELPFIFCNYAVPSCGTWRNWPGQSTCNVLSISDLELYVT